MATGKRHRITRDPSQVNAAFTDVHWSPGSDWLVFSKGLTHKVGRMVMPATKTGLFLYHVADRSLHQLSRGQYSDQAPVFSHDDRYLLFASDRIVDPAFSRFDTVTASLNSSGLYAATLSKTTASPIAPRVRTATSGHEDDPAATSGSDDKTGADATDSAGDDKDTGKDKKSAKPAARKAEHKHTAPVAIDVKRLMDRAVRLDVPAANISQILEAKGVVFYVTEPNETLGDPLTGEKPELRAYDLKKRKEHTLEKDVSDVTLSADGSTLFYQHDGQWTTRPASFDKDPGDQAMAHMDVSKIQRWVQPRAEWPTIFGEAMRDVRDYFVNPQLIARDWPAISARYRRLMPRAASRDDVNWLIANAIGTPGESHMYVKDGDKGWRTPAAPSADLGADFALDKTSGRYYLRRIYQGDNTVPGYRAPLHQPGLKIKAGDFVLAVNGQPLRAPMNPYALLNGTFGTTIALKIADNAQGAHAHTIHVEPVVNAHKLHMLAWIRHNRQQIARLSHGQIGYVYLEDMGETGMQQFVRQYYSQLNKKAIIFDDRWNLGGFIDSILFDRIARQLGSMSVNRHMGTYPSPNAFGGYMAALINRGSASDGDIFAYMFKQKHLGPTIGSRTWAGVRGYWGPFDLLDGGELIVSEDAMYGLDSKWVIENIGVKPDIPVHNDPGQLNQGHDAQIEKAVAVLMAKIKTKPRVYPQPPTWLPAFPPQPDYPKCGTAAVGDGACQ